MNLGQGREFTSRARCLRARRRKTQVARGRLRLVQYAWETINLSVYPGALNCILLTHYVNLWKYIKNIFENIIANKKKVKENILGETI